MRAASFRPDVWRDRLIARVPRLILFPRTGRLLPFSLKAPRALVAPDVRRSKLPHCGRLPESWGGRAGQICDPKSATINAPSQFPIVVGRVFHRTVQTNTSVCLSEIEYAPCLAAFCLLICATMAMAQTKSEDTKLGDSPSSDGRVVLPDNKGQPQPRAGPARSRPASAVRQQQVHGGHAASPATRAWRCDYDDR